MRKIRPDETYEEWLDARRREQRRRRAEKGDETRAKAREWYAANKEKHARYRDPEKHRQRARRWREENPERARQRSKEYRQANHDKVKARARAANKDISCLLYTSDAADEL